MATIFVDDFLKGNDPSSTREAIQEAISHLSDGDVLLFGKKKEYRIDGEIVLENLSRIQVDGRGSTIVKEGYDPRSRREQSHTILHLKRLHGSAIRGFQFDYAENLSASGRISAVGRGYVDLELVPADRSLTGEESFMAVDTLDEDGTVNHDIAHSVADHYACEKIDEKTLRIHCPTQQGKVGELLVARMAVSGRAAPLALCERCHDMLLEDIRIFKSPCMVFYISSDSGSYTFRHIVAKAREGSGRLVGANADIFHVCGIKGSLAIEDSTFVGLGDDVLNVHTCGARVLEVKGREVLLEEAYFRTSLRADYAEVGQSLSAYDFATFRSKGTAAIEKREGDRIVFKEEIPHLRPGDFLANVSLLPKVVVRNCHFDSGRARALLIRSHDVLIEKCTFAHFALPAVLVAADLDFWFEMVPAKRVIIRDNTFTRVGEGATDTILGAVSVKLSDDKVFLDYGHDIFEDITISGNAIDGTSKNGIFAQSVRRLSVIDNRISHYGERPNSHPGNDWAIRLVNCDEVTVEGNLFDAAGVSVESRP